MLLLQVSLPLGPLRFPSYLSLGFHSPKPHQGPSLAQLPHSSARVSQEYLFTGISLRKTSWWWVTILAAVWSYSWKVAHPAAHRSAPALWWDSGSHKLPSTCSSFPCSILALLVGFSSKEKPDLIKILALWALCHVMSAIIYAYYREKSMPAFRGRIKHDCQLSYISGFPYQHLDSSLNVLKIQRPESLESTFGF